MITVYKFMSAWGQPDLSPFVFKVETYLRMIGVEYRGVHGDARKAPKRKLPYIDHDGRRIADSTFIVDYLKEAFGDRLDAKLEPRQCALGMAVQSMLEEHFYFVLLYQRWKESRGWESYSKILRGYARAAGVPSPLHGAVLFAARRQILRALDAQGTGRHASHEVDVIGRRIVSALATWMGDGPFFLGSEPTSIDATVYPFLTGLMDTPLSSETKHHANSLTPLRAYVERMKNRYWADG